MRPPGSDINKRVAVLGCKHTTRDLIIGLERLDYRFDHCITIGPETAERQQVAGYMDLRPFLDSRRIPYTIARQYSLNDDGGRDRLLSLGLDMLLVMGWQRLIPAWWLESLSIGAFGMHGSSKPLPHGRGRSPLNWSLIQGKSGFYTHLFRYRAGVDDGDIAGVQTFDITPWDTCLTLHFKNTVAMVQLCAKLLPGLLSGTARLTPQPTEGATYYPKRAAEDGLIIWNGCTHDIYNLVRAVTTPFPGAFTFLNDDFDRKITIWHAVPFDAKLAWPRAVPGQIVEVFYNGSFVVKTGDTTLLVTESEGHAFCDSDVRKRFGTAGLHPKVWENLPE